MPEMQYVPEPLASELLDHGLHPGGGVLPLAYAAAALAEFAEPWFDWTGARFAGVEFDHRMFPANSGLLPDGASLAAHAAAAANALTARLARDPNRTAVFGDALAGLQLTVSLSLRSTHEDPGTATAPGQRVAVITLCGPNWISGHYWPALSRKDREPLTTVVAYEQHDAIIAAWRELADAPPAEPGDDGRAHQR